jgi:hypothetical protein
MGRWWAVAFEGVVLLPQLSRSRSRSRSRSSRSRSRSEEEETPATVQNSNNLGGPSS